MRSLLTIAQVAERLAASAHTIRRRIQSGALPAIRDGGLIRVREEDLERYLAERTIRQPQRRARAQRIQPAAEPVRAISGQESRERVLRIMGRTA